jgi:hypothetical protein
MSSSLFLVLRAGFHGADAGAVARWALLRLL